MVACGFIMIDQDGKILIVRDKRMDDSIVISFPKGSREKTDKSKYFAARREFIEETGLENFEYGYLKTPHIEYNEKGNESCYLFLAWITQKFENYGFISDHVDVGGETLNAEFLSHEELLNSDIFSPRRKDTLQTALLLIDIAKTSTEYNCFDVFIRPRLQMYISKRMSWLLRHNISNLDHDSGMFVDLNLILYELNKESEEHITLTMIQNVVDHYQKQRFQIIENKIRAVQGHSNVTIYEEDIFQEITESIPYVVHMTNRKSLKQIIQTGLNRMSRTHIHFADDESLLKKNQPIKIKLNMQAAMDAGIKFYRANNGVILSPGNAEGSIPIDFLIVN